MEHLDLAGYITTPTTNWTLPVFDQQDAIYLSSSRQMLEPIMEETSEDEEYSQSSWSQYDQTSHVWSSTESETGSVIRIEITKDPDSISERDFACPAKRPRRSDEFLNTLSPQQQPTVGDDTVLLRRNLQRNSETFGGGLESLERNSMERFLAFEAASRDSLGANSQQRSSTGSRRFDDFYSDSDSLSYQSLSRSSSLIQFESLERQMLQEQHNSLGSLGNSSPSLLSFDGALEETRKSSGDIGGSGSGCGSGHINSGGNSGSNSGNNSRRGSQNSLLRRFESTDGRLHQTYYELDKLNFDDDDDKEMDNFGSGHFGGVAAKCCSSSMELITRSSGATEIRSDSESSTSSSSSGNSILTASKPFAEDAVDSTKKSGNAAYQRVNGGGGGGKNSAENLSEDSGYCEPSQSLRRSKSKSIPKNFEKFCEEDEFYNDNELDVDDDDVDDEDEDEEDDDSQNTHSKNSTVIEHDICQPKIAALDATFLVESTAVAAAAKTTLTANATALPEAQQPPLWLYYDGVKNSATARDTQPQQQQQQHNWEQQKLKREQRLLAHSPSPVSDAGSTTSSSSCASANSFTWLPTHAHSQQQQQQHQQQQQQQQRQLIYKQLLPQTLDFPEHLRNSLPDIRDANGSFSLDTNNGHEEYFRNSQFSSKFSDSGATPHSYVVDSKKSLDTSPACCLIPSSPTSLDEKNSRLRTSSLTDDSDTSTGGETSSSSSSSSSSTTTTTKTSSTSATTCTESDQSCVELAIGAKAAGKTKHKQTADIVSVGDESGRISSVPSELDKIGRKKRSSKSKHSRIKSHNWTSDSELSDRGEEEAGGDAEFEGSARIRRSCSWTERKERNLQKFEGAFGAAQKRSVQTQSLGYMNASYHNLTLLDYSGNEDIGATGKNRANFKRAGWSSMETSSSSTTRKSAGDADYEGLICKGNFLLDELSEIYDKNASILNDKILENDEDELRTKAAIREEYETKVERVPLNASSPIPPARQRAPSSSSHSDVDSNLDKSEVQHVQLTLRKPPARQKANGANVASAEIQPTFVSFGKTFDQDPTNLRTSYAQSLEKCNFDAKELSNSDLTATRTMPKRRFQSHAAASKKRNMVSSTPNLNAFDPGADELEDDIYVTSAHASMHQLPQSATGQKPLGILLPAGSRSSFGKEVSFCPVVSKYMWQEQSSEECNEPSSSTERQDSKDEESTDDELLDNADATVIYNTKENEVIAARYNDENQQLQCEAVKKEQRKNGAKQRAQPEEHKQREPPPPPPSAAAQRATAQQREVAVLEKVRATILTITPPPAAVTTKENIAKTSPSQATDNNEVLVDDERAAQSATLEKLGSNVETKPSTVSQLTTTFGETTLTERKIAYTSASALDSSAIDNANITTTSPSTRPLSLHLPILSEPPTNRAHVLYASQQLINQLQDQQQHRSQISGAGESARAQSAINLSTTVRPPAGALVTKMSKNGIVNYTDNGPDGAGGAVAKPYNNNNELMKGKFKADEKHPSSKGFLSRFAHGFRFSLRRNKKKHLQQQEQQQPVTEQVSTLEKYAKAEKSKIAQNGAKSSAGVSGKSNSSDYVFIPLKGPLPNANGNGNAATVAAKSNGKQHVSAQQPAAVAATTQQMIVTGKPPLPKQPPRSEKLPQQQRAGTPAHYGSNSNKTAANFATAQFYIATPVAVGSPAPKTTTIDECFLDSERSYYDDFKNQLNSGMQANGRMYAAGAAATAAAADASAVSMDPNPIMPLSLADASSPSRASVSQKTQMFNNLSGGGAGAENVKIMTQNNIVIANHHGKIGLIETNLDTHETVISGKTRSLMELGPQQLQQQQTRFKYVKRGGGGQGTQSGYQADGDDDDEDVSDANAVVNLDGIDGAGGVIVKGLPQQAGQIASVRRPHKSMEFLLDKENQKNVLPPENELQKSHEQNPNALSEHQLRVQASLQRLNIPDWYRQYEKTTARSPDGGSVGAYKPGNFTRKRTSESGRWTGLNSKTTSLSSLGSQRSDRSPLLLSPSAHSHHGGQSSVATMGAHHHHHQHVSGAQSYTGTSTAGAGGGNFSRWSTSHLNSSQTSPSCSQRGSFSRGGPVNSSFISVASGQSGMNAAVRSSFRQPYLGWRSQEKLSQRTPHERLASSLLAAQQQRITSSSSQKSDPNGSGGIKQQPPVTPEIQSSIKEVTSAIVHYVNDQTQQQRSRSTSPNSRKCWLESSFVGIRPLDSPQTPIIENTTTAFNASAATAAAAALQQQFNSNNTTYNNSSISSGYYNNSSANSSIHSAGIGGTTTGIGGTTNIDVLRMNGLSFVGGGTGAPERSLSSASLEDVLASLLGLPSNTAGTAGASTSDAYTRSTTADSASESLTTFRHMPQAAAAAPLGLHPNTTADQQRLRRRSEGDQKQQQQQHQQQDQQQQQFSQNAKAASGSAGAAASATTTGGAAGTSGNSDTLPPPRRVSLGDSSDSNNKTTSELQIKCRNTKCDQTATPTDAKKYYKSCHNCSHLYCSRECRRAHWEKHRKACLHSRASNLCRQVLATCKDDLDSQRHLSLLARKGFLSQGRGVVRVLFRSAESAEGFIKHGFQCMGEASYVRWPDLMPAEMGLELYSELLKLSTEYKPDSKMLIYVAICVVSEAPGNAQAPVRWERQLVSRCAKLKLCKTILSELEQQHQALQMQQPIALVTVPEPTTEILILTFNPSAHATATKREIVLSNILNILSRRGVFLRKHYPEIYQRLQTYADGQTDKFNPVTLHPRDAQTGQSFVCIIMPVHSESGLIRMPSVADGGNRVNTIDVGAPNALINMDATADATQALQS